MKEYAAFYLESDNVTIYADSQSEAEQIAKQATPDNDKFLFTAEVVDL